MCVPALSQLIYAHYKQTNASIEKALGIYGNHSEPLKLVHAFACRLCDLTCIGILRCTQVDLLQKGKIPGGAGLPPFPL